MEITAKMVSDLREKTGAGMMKCKEALVECKGDLGKAVDYLRKKGLASAEGKSGRATSQGLIKAAVSSDQKTAAILEVNCETDFVAKNEHFQELTTKLLDLILSKPEITDVESLQKAVLPDGQKADDARKALVSKTGENMTFGRCERLVITTGSHAIFDTYIHGEGKIGVVIQVECPDQKAAQSDQVRSFAHEAALQVTAMKPRYVSRNDVPPAELQHEREIVLGQIKNDPKNANKPENILTKIVDGRLDKFFKEFCLLEQVYVKDDTKTVGALTDDLSKAFGGPVRIIGFRRWALGEKAASAAPAAEKTCCASCGG